MLTSARFDSNPCSEPRPPGFNEVSKESDQTLGHFALDIETGPGKIKARLDTIPCSPPRAPSFNVGVREQRYRSKGREQ